MPTSLPSMTEEIRVEASHPRIEVIRAIISAAMEWAGIGATEYWTCWGMEYDGNQHGVGVGDRRCDDATRLTPPSISSSEGVFRIRRSG